MHLSDVCPSVRLSLCHRPQHQTSQQQNLLLWLGRQEISIDCCTVHSVVSVRSGINTDLFISEGNAIFNDFIMRTFSFVFRLSGLFISATSTALYETELNGTNLI